MNFPGKKVTIALITSHFVCAMLGWYFSGLGGEGAILDELESKNNPAARTNSVPGQKSRESPKVLPPLVAATEQAPLVYDGSGRISMDIDKLSLSIQPILSNFDLDPRFFDLLGVNQQQQQQIREILLDQKKKQDDLETNSFKLLEQQGGNATFVVENTPDAAKESRKLLEDKITDIIGPNASKVFIKCGEEFLKNNVLYTDNVKVFTTEVLPPELAQLTGTNRSINVWTLSRQWIPPNTTIDADFIKSARANNFLSGGEGYSNKDIPDRLLHLIE